MSIEIEGFSTVYKNPRYYCGPGPGVVCDDEGKIIVAFRRVLSWLDAGHTGHWHPATESCLTRSVDRGETWSAPQVFAAGNQCPCLTRLRDGTLVHSTHRMELVPEEVVVEEGPGVRKAPWSGLHTGTATWRSEDAGRTWQEPVFLPGVPGQVALYANLHAPVAVRGNVLEDRMGRLLVSAYSLGDINVAHIFASDDQGQSWAYLAPIAEDFNETFLYETESGALVAFMRCWSESTYLHRARSEDGGRTWSAPEPVCRGYPACVERLPSGRVLLVYGFRFEEGYGLRARVLSAECDGEIGPEFILRADGAVADLGYPDSCLLPDGRVLVVYYMNQVGDAPDNAAPRFIEACFLREN